MTLFSKETVRKLLRNPFGDKKFFGVDLKDRSALSLGEFMTIQAGLQEVTAGELWRDFITPEMLKLAIQDELAELQNCFPWKWWKKMDKADIWNVKIEVVDIFHFILAAHLLRENSPEDYSTISFPTPYVAVNIYESMETPGFHSTLWEMLNVFDAGYTFYNFAKLLSYVDMNFEEFSAIYVAKATLNQLRQEGGYKHGTYVKNKDGMEDNARMEAIVDCWMCDRSDLDNLVKCIKEEFCVVEKG